MQLERTEARVLGALIEKEYTTPDVYPLTMKGGGSCGHYGGNAETYMNVGLGLGEAMVELLQAE